MGCCHNRESEAYKRQSSKILQDWKFQDFQTLDSDNYITDSMDIQELKSYLKMCKKTNNFFELGRLMTLQEKVDTNLHIAWASKPETLGSLSVLYLTMMALQEPESIKDFFPFLPALIKFIKNGSDEMRENCLILLSLYMRVANKEGIERLLNLNIMNLLVRWFNCSKPEIRMVSCSILASIYKESVTGKERFYKVNGPERLLQLIAQSSDDEESLLILLQAFKDLIIGSDGEKIEYNIQRLDIYTVKAVLYNIDPISKPKATKRVDSILKIILK